MTATQAKISTTIGVSREKLFDFHQNPRNMIQILPRFIRVGRIDCEPIAKPGDEFVVKLWAPFPVTWRGRWHVVRPPEILVDVALKSPFSYWRHEHRFEEVAGGTRLTETVEIRFGHGRAGALAAAAFARIPLPLLFKQRQMAMKDYLERTSTT